MGGTLRTIQWRPHQDWNTEVSLRHVPTRGPGALPGQRAGAPVAARVDQRETDGEAEAQLEVTLTTEAVIHPYFPRPL